MTRRMVWARRAVGAGLLALLASLGPVSPAAGQPPPVPDPGVPDPVDPAGPPDPGPAFAWDNDNQRRAFERCLDIVDFVADDQPGAFSGPSLRVPPGIGEDLWDRATDGDHFAGLGLENFTYRPLCHFLLPGEYEGQIAPRFFSEVYRRCLTAVGGGTVRRPQAVPAWFWEVSLLIGDCYLLLPRGAFGLGEGGNQDDNDWSGWTTAQEVEYPETHDNPDILAEYQVCLEFIDWRMANGQRNGSLTLNPTRWFNQLDGKFEDPPRGKAPKRLWHEALDFYQNPAARFLGGEDLTIPNEWRPHCELLLVVEECRPSTKDDPTLLPEQCVGPHAIANYDINYSQYDDPDEQSPSISRNLWGGSTNFAFHLGKGGVQVALWAVGWAYSFDIRDYDPLAIQLGDSYQTNLLGHEGFRLRELCWLILFAWAGMTALRRRLAVAGAEVLTTIVLLLLSAVLLAERERYMNAVWTLMDEASTTLLVAGLRSDPEQPKSREQLVRDLQARVQEVFVEEPYDYLNWNASLGEANDPTNPLQKCAAARYYIVSRGPHGTDELPRTEMAAAGAECREFADFNRDPDGTRLLGAVLVMFSAFAVGVLLTLVALTVVVAKLVACLLFGILPFVAVVVILPAQGRRLAWSFGAAILQAITAVIGMSFVLSVLLLSLTGLADIAGDIALIERFALMNLIVLIAFGARRNVLRGGQAFAARLSEYLSTTRGTGANWAAAAVGAEGGSRGGLNLLNVDRAVGQAAYVGLGGPANLVARTVLIRRRENRVARKSYRNLERVAVWKRARNARNTAWVAQHPKRKGRVPVRRQQLP